jgi:hypothetical protein
MPSFDEIFTVTGVFVGTDVDVASGVSVNAACVVDVGFGSGVDVDDGGVATLWQAVSKEMERRRGMICFIVYFFVMGY